MAQYLLLPIIEAGRPNLRCRSHAGDWTPQTLSFVMGVPIDPHNRGLWSGTGTLSAWQESPVRTKLKPQFLSQRLALPEPLEEFVEHADNDGIDAHAFGFGPFFELGTSFGADVDELRVREIHASLAGLLNIDFVFIHMA